MKNFLATALLLSSLLSAEAQKVDYPLIQETVEFLSSDALKGRSTGTYGEEVAAQYIATKMKMMGLKPMGTEGYFQHFSVTPKANPHAAESDKVGEPINGMNVVGFLDHQKEQTIVIGAHFDHLGEGGEGSLYAGKEPQIHNGADDNASGVALLLALAEEMVDDPEDFQANNYLFIAFSGEEKGLWGSNYFCKNPTIDLSTVNFMLNFDMVGRLDLDKGLAINGVGTSPFWEKAIPEANEDSIKLITSESGVGPSDHTSFYLQDIPVLHFFTGQHEDYHKPSDDADKVNIEGIVMIQELISDLVELSPEQKKIEFTKTKDESESTPRFKVTLGVMPDYMFQGEGMKIDGVTEGRPAHKAGFQKGDVVIQMGEHKVDGMMAYMKALSKFKSGDETVVKVKRGEEVVEAEVIF
ncbi:MAG: peptidase M28 [Flavobacteriales bacterium]|nr:peptidase M28 [Flavobacteriales bacterium]|tara:strand:- start:15813 stop:17045 length:1233 start_codon:yes stop_codon:yes gene_type:complete